MVTTILLSTGVAVLLWMAGQFWRKRRGVAGGEEIFVGPRRKRTSIYIICGNCGGEDPLPYKTFMDIHGCCETCGGRSFMLASLWALLNYRGRGMRIRALSTPPRVLSFEKRRTA